MAILKKIWRLLTPKERKQAIITACFVLAAALTDALGIASILPFLTILANPESIETNQWLNKIYSFFDFNSPREFLFYLGVLTLAMVILSSTIQFLSQFYAIKFAEMRRVSIGTRLLTRYLTQPYPFFLTRNSGDLTKNVLSEVDNLISRCLMPVVLLFSYGLHAAVIILLTIILEPKIGIVGVFIIGGIFCTIYLSLKKKINEIGQRSLAANHHRFRVTHEAFGGIKQIKLHSLEYSFANNFKQKTFDFSNYNASNEVMSIVPRFGIQVIIYGGMLTLLLILISQGEDIKSILPTMGLLAFAGARLLPGFQNVYRSVVRLKFGTPSLDLILNDLGDFRENIEILEPSAKQESIEFHQSIKLQNITYHYDMMDTPALNNVNMTISFQKTIGIVGLSGAGKSTIIDIILGLYKPSAGKLLIDSTVIDDSNLQSWQSNIGYVPQEIYLLDAPIKDNIAFGQSEIDMERVTLAAKRASLDDFITRELENGYDTVVGERGIRLSGGQRQRIGIARALYHDPAILVFDEATSAVDNITEREILESITQLSKSKTIIMVAHRLNTVEHCNIIYVMESGRVVANGTYSELAKNNEVFRAMLGTQDND